MNDSAIGERWEDVERGLFTPEEIADSNLRVALYRGQDAPPDTGREREGGHGKYYAKSTKLRPYVIGENAYDDAQETGEVKRMSEALDRAEQRELEKGLEKDRLYFLVGKNAEKLY